MATVLYELKDCVVKDTGEVIVKYKHFVIERLLARKPVQGLKVERQSFAEKVVEHSFRGLTDLPLCDVEYHNQHCPVDRRIEIDENDDTAEGPPDTSFDFNLPDDYLGLDLVEYLAERLAEKFPNGVPEDYVERLMMELNMMSERHMDDFVRSLIYMVNTWDANHIVHGVGRGSACASLVLYLVGVHMVDPIEYEIPIDEFLR